MDHITPPECWRSEAFAEDLCEANDTLPSHATASHAGFVRPALLGALPLLLATAGAAVAAWSGAV